MALSLFGDIVKDCGSAKYLTGAEWRDGGIEHEVVTEQESALCIILQRQAANA